MKIQQVIALLGILCCVRVAVAQDVHVNLDGDISTINDTLEAWSCDLDQTVVSEDYKEKVSDLLDVMQIDIMTHSSWDLLCRMTGGSGEDVVGSAGCLPSHEMKTREQCFTCIVEARGHLARRCVSSFRGAVFLKSCTLTYARVEPATEEPIDWEEEVVDDDHVPERRVDS